MKEESMCDDNMTTIFSTLDCVADGGSNMANYVSFDNTPISNDQVGMPTQLVDSVNERKSNHHLITILIF